MNKCSHTLRSLLTSWSFFMKIFTSSWAVERWNLSSVSFLLTFFWNQSERIWYYVSSPRLNKCSFSFYPLKAKYVELMGKEKGYDSSHVSCQAKRWSKKNFNDFEKGFWNGMMEGEKMESHQKGSLKLKCFSLLKILTSPFIWGVSWSFPLFLPFFSFFYAPSLEDLGVLMIFEEKITSSKTSLQMAWYGMPWSWLWIYWWWMHILEWSYAHQYS
jgi:hypothetical protein